MDSSTIARKKLKSLTHDVSVKTSITCTNMPEELFDSAAAKHHFSKFGRVTKIILRPKRRMCVIEYDTSGAAERALLNAGAFDGFMFDVTWTKLRSRRRSRKDDDPDWVPDSDIEEELSAMSGGPTYRSPRQKPMEIDKSTVSRVFKQLPVAKKTPPPKKAIVSQPFSGTESPIIVPGASLTTLEAATELQQLRSRISLSADEQRRTLEARDRILRAWGGTGARVKIAGATIGTCPDMCPEKERLQREAEFQIMSFESRADSDSSMERWRAVKQYTRSSADQEMPMCYELRPARILRLTCSYLLHEIAETDKQVNLADWFHFMWDRLRGIRKDITQQALCCAESIHLVEMCTRFHAHCAARLADLDHTQFDQKLNTDNLTKCLQTLKHMYSDVSTDQKPREAEFRGYIALLNLGNANFWWEVKHLRQDIQKSVPITFAIKIFNALDNNNYVRFFRLVKEKASYLQACILLRYFNDVRARALARIVKAYAPRGGSRYPAEDLMQSLAFENVEHMKSFITHYGLHTGKTDDPELSIILDRNQFFEDSDPYPIRRAVKLIEVKRTRSVGETIAGGPLPEKEYKNHKLHTSFTDNGSLKESSLVAEDQNYSTLNNSNKDIKALRAEIARLSQTAAPKLNEIKGNLFSKMESKLTHFTSFKTAGVENMTRNNAPDLFSFNPAIPVASNEIIIKSPEKFSPENKKFFSFSKPVDSLNSKIMPMKEDKISTSNTYVNSLQWHKPSTTNLFTKTPGKVELNNPARSALGLINHDGKSLFNDKNYVTSNCTSKSSSIFVKKDSTSNIFGKSETNNNLFANNDTNVYLKNKVNNIFTNTTDTTNIFGKTQTGISGESGFKVPNNLFSQTNKLNDVKVFNTQNVFGKPVSIADELSPATVFKNASAISTAEATKPYSIFQSKNNLHDGALSKSQSSVAAKIFNSVNVQYNTKIYGFDEEEYDLTKQKNEEFAKLEEMKKLEELKKQEELKREEEERREEIRINEEKRKQEELKFQEEKKRAEELKQQEIKRKLEEEKRQAELKRKAEEEKNKLLEIIENESKDTVEQLLEEVNSETVRNILLDEMENMKQLLLYAEKLNNEIISEFCCDISELEIKAEKHRTDKLMKKWYIVWRKRFLRNLRRRSLLENTPIWLPDKSPEEKAAHLRRAVEPSTLNNLSAFCNGHKFNGKPKLLPILPPYNIMDIIRSSLLKRMKAINYPYNKYFFWKVTLATFGSNKWMNRKIQINKWLISMFSDNEEHHESPNLIQVKKQSWNSLMNFGISVTLTNSDSENTMYEALNGTNGILYYVTEEDIDLCRRIEIDLKKKHIKQILPLAMITSCRNENDINLLDELLSDIVTKKYISCYRVFPVNPECTFESLNTVTKSALKWLAKHYPPVPNLEIDLLKSMCQRYLGDEIWIQLKRERQTRVGTLFEDLNKLITFYNAAVEGLKYIITDEDLCDYPNFPLEFLQFLDDDIPYPKPYEYIPSSVKNYNYLEIIKETLNQLILPHSMDKLYLDDTNMQQQIRTYCEQIGWFSNPEEIVCKVVSVLTNELANSDLNTMDIVQNLEHHDLLDFLSILIHEKINSLNNIDNMLAMYNRNSLSEYRLTSWWYSSDIFVDSTRKALKHETDEIDYFIEAKRRKLADDSMEMLQIEERDCTLLEENIKIVDETISSYKNCTINVRDLEEKIEEERRKAERFEEFLRSALEDA